MLLYLVFCTLAIGAAFFVVLPPNGKRAVQEKPVAWIGRMLCAPIMLRLFMISLPGCGFLIDGCFWNSINGIGSLAVIAPVVLPSWLKLGGFRSPFPEAKLNLAAISLATVAVSGVMACYMTGDDSCAWYFLAPCCWLLVSGLLHGAAYLKGEGNAGAGTPPASEWR